MSGFSLTKTHIETAAKSALVASAAGVSSSNWAVYHVFYGESSYIGARNRGRLPFIEIKRQANTFTHEAEPNYGGTNELSYRVEIHVGQASRKDMASAEDWGYAIATVFIKELRNQSSFWSGNHTIQPIEESPFGHSIAIDITAELTGDEDHL